MNTPKYSVEFNRKINRGQIKFTNINVAVAEFYENTTGPQEDISIILRTYPDLLTLVQRLADCGNPDVLAGDARVLLGRLATGRETTIS